MFFSARLRAEKSFYQGALLWCLRLSAHSKFSPRVISVLIELVGDGVEQMIPVTWECSMSEHPLPLRLQGLPPSNLHTNESPLHKAKLIRNHYAHLEANFLCLTEHVVVGKSHRIPPLGTKRCSL